MELLDYVWKKLTPEEEEGVRSASEALIADVYQQGFIDARRFSLSQWKGACQKFAKGKGLYRFQRADLDSLKNYFFQAQIKKPFDPRRLKDGPRPLAWTGELYQKVLRFETNLTLEAWKQIVNLQILPKFKKGEDLLYNAAFKALLEAVLEKHASPLRRLELWYHSQREAEAAAEAKPEGEAAPAPKPAAPVVIRDAFVAKPDETLKRTAIDKLYFHHGETPKGDDRENLDFLDELAKLGDEEELP